MPVNAGTVYVSVLPDTKAFTPALQKQMVPVAKTMSQKMSTVGKSMSKFVTVPIAAGFAYMIGQANEARKVTAQTQAVIKSMGNTAGISAKQVGTLAESISKKAGIDDEAIQSGENLLLTFANIRNEVGKGNDIFTQTTKVMVDMSVALGQDMKSSAIQLGKALNDPIKGVSALQRVGVSFTEQQKDQIKAMVEANDLMGAQKLILSELTRQFGGSAAAQATAGQKMMVSLGNIAESFGAILLPVVDAVAGGFGLLLRGMDALPGPIKAVAVAALGLTALTGPILWLIGSGFGAKIAAGLAKIRAALVWLSTHPVLLVITAAVTALAGAFEFTRRQTERNRKAFKQFGAELVDLYQKTDALNVNLEDFRTTMRDVPGFVDPFAAAIKAVTSGLADASLEAEEAEDILGRFLPAVFRDNIALLRQLASWYGYFLPRSIKTSADAIEFFVADLQGARQATARVTTATRQMATLTGEELKSLRESVVSALGGATAALSRFTGDVKFTFRQSLNELRRFNRRMREMRSDWDDLLGRGIRGLDENFLAALTQIFGVETPRVLDVLNAKTDEKLQKWVRQFLQADRGPVRLANSIGDIPTDVNVQVTADTKKAEEAIRGFNQRIQSTEVGVTVTTTGLGAPKAHGGGWITGPAGKDIPARLQAGEFVIRRDVAQKVGPFLETLNKDPKGGRRRPGVPPIDGFQRFHEGGVVGGLHRHDQMIYQMAEWAKAVRDLAAMGGFRLSNASAAGLNARALFALRAYTGTWPFTSLLSGYRPGAIVRGTSTPSQHGFGNAIDMTASPYSKLWAPFDWSIRNAAKLALNYTVLSAFGRNPLQWSRGSGFSAPSAINTADHRNHQHLDFYPSMHRGGRIARDGVYNLEQGERVLSKETADAPTLLQLEVDGKTISQVVNLHGREQRLLMKGRS